MNKLLIFVLIFFLHTMVCHSQKMKTPNINKRIEKFADVVSSLETIIKRKNKQNSDIEKLSTSRPTSYYGGTNYYISDHNFNHVIYYQKSSDGGYSGYDYSQNPLIGIYREFHPNGSIKTKGLFCWFGFNIGIWYYFNEKGDIIKTMDYDEGFEFSFEQVFKFCEENKISFQKKPVGPRTEIQKRIIDGNQHYWHIEYPLIETIEIDNSKISISDLETNGYIKINEKEYFKAVRSSIKLDGKTGKIIEKKEYPLPIIE